jgi:hypothetical protein
MCKYGVKVEFKKLMKINLDIVKDVTYKHAKSSFQNSLYCATKKQNLMKIYIYLDVDVCHLCVSQNRKYFNVIFCTFMG